MTASDYTGGTGGDSMAFYESTQVAGGEGCGIVKIVEEEVYPHPEPRLVSPFKMGHNGDQNPR